MRKKIISFLFANKILRLFLPLFHWLIGGSRIISKKGNKFDTTTANLYKSRISFNGTQGNQVSIGEHTDLHNATITFKGDNNSLYIGANSFLNGLNLIIEGNNNSISIGDNVFILDDTRIYVVDGSCVAIGDCCMLSDHIEIRTTDNHAIYDKVSGKRINFEQNVMLGDHTWLGTRVTLLKGVELAEGTIVGAGSVVTQSNLIPNAIIAGNPARMIREDVRWTMERGH